MYAGSPCGLYDSLQRVYRMWFFSRALNYGVKGCVSSAVSTDGETWYLYAKKPDPHAEYLRRYYERRKEVLPMKGCALDQ